MTLRHSKPLLRGACEYRFHRADRGCEGGILADRVHTRIKAKEFKDHLIEVKAAATAGLPAGQASACSIMALQSAVNCSADWTGRNPSVNQYQKKRSTH